MSTIRDRGIFSRKQGHLDVCCDEKQYSVEGSFSAEFSSIQFLHNALPELDYDDIRLEAEFLGKKISFPFFISCMTGGTKQGYIANQELAKAAQKCNVPLGLGSMRVVFDRPKSLRDFQLRKWAPDIPIMANLGAVQLRDIGLKRVWEWVQKLEVDALVIHLNCGQELFQVGGDHDFRGLLGAIGQAVEGLKIPIIVKETGFGIHPSLVKKLIALGVHFVDLAGSGGTNWILVEKGCREVEDPVASEFASWGIPTAPLIAATRDYGDHILASGGLRSGMDFVKSLALGAWAGGMALPFIRAVIKGGEDQVSFEIMRIKKVLRSVMMLTGCHTLEALRTVPLNTSLQFEKTVNTLKLND